MTGKGAERQLPAPAASGLPETRSRTPPRAPPPPFRDRTTTHTNSIGSSVPGMGDEP